MKIGVRAQILVTRVGRAQETLRPGDFPSAEAALPATGPGYPRAAVILQERDLAMTIRSRLASRLIEVGSLPDEKE
jgi:hypothetical protein